MSKLAEFREKNPAYKDVPDENLAPALHRKFYSHIPQDEFYRQIGFGEKQAPGLIKQGIAAVGSLRQRMQAETNENRATSGVPEGPDSPDEQNRAILAYQKREREAAVRGELALRQSEVPADGYFPDNQSRAPGAVDRPVAERRIRERNLAAGRTTGEVVSDAAGAVGAGMQQILASFVGLFAPDSETAERMQRAAQAADGNLSPFLQARLEEARERIQAAAQDGLWDEVKVAADEYLTDPTLFSYFALRTMPSMLGVLGPAKLAQAAAAMRGASAAQIAKVTAGAAGAANAGMTGGDARQQAYDTIYQALREQGVPDEEARARALEESRLSAGVGAVLGWLGGKYGAEAGMLGLGAGRTAAGRAAGVIAGETGTELAEELAPQLLTNSLASRIDGRNPLEGLGETAAQTVAGIGPMATAGAVGAARQPATEADAAGRDLADLVEGAQFVQPADQAARQLLDPENAQLTEVPDAAASLDATGDQGQGANPRGGAGLARDGGEGAAGGSGAAGEAAPGGGAGMALGDPAGQSTAGVVDPLDQLLLEREAAAIETGDPIEVLVAQAEGAALRAAAGPREAAGAALLGFPQSPQVESAKEVPALPRSEIRADGTLYVAAPVEAVQNLTQALGVTGLAGKLLRTRNNETVVSAKTAGQVNAALRYALEPFQYSAQDQADVELLARAQGARPGAIQLVTPDALPATVQGASDARLSAADAIFLGRVLGANARSLVLFRADPKEVGLGGAIIRGRTGKVFLNVAGAINPVAEAVHEVGHSIRRENEGAYQAYLSALASTQALDMSDGALISWAQANFDGGVTSLDGALKAAGVANRDALLEEFVMDATGRASVRPGFWDTVFDELSKTNPSALQAFIQGMKALAARLRQELFQRGARFAGIEKHIRDLEKLTELAGRYYAQGAKAAGQKVSDAHAEAGTVVASKQRIGPFAKAESARATQEWHARQGVQYEIEQTPEGVFLARVGDTNGQASSAQGTGAGLARREGVRGVQPQDPGQHQRADGRPERGTAVAGPSGERGGYNRGDSRPTYGRPGKPGSVTVVGTHFSRQQRATLAGALFGTGHAAEEARRLEGADPAIRSRIYFYVDEGNGINAEAGTGGHAHEVELSNLYDWDTDSEGVVSRNYRAGDHQSANVVEKALVDAGYDGYYKAAAFGAAGKTQGVAVLLGKRHLGVPVAYLGQGDGKIPARPGAKPVKTDTVSPVTQAKELAARARALKGLPAGELPASRWRDMLAGADEEVFQAFDKAGLLDGEERVYLSELAGRYVRQAAAGEVVRSPTRTLEKENQVSITVGGKPGEFGWSPAAKLAAAQQEPAMDPAKLEGKEVPPFVGPTQQRPSLEAIGEAVRKVLAAKSARDTIEALTGARITGVAQIAGSWEGKPEPSFVLTGEMSFEQANEASKVLGFLMAQDATVAAQPWFEEADGQIPAILISQNKVMTAEQVQRLADAARAAGLDYSTSVDGRGAKFLHFGDQDGYLALRAAVDEIRKAAGLKELTDFYVRSNLNDAETYLEGGVGSLLREERDQAGTGGPSDLFRRAVDSILVPYAKAVGAEGYRFSPERYGRRFGLTDAEVEYIRAALRPKSGKALSTVPIVTGAEKLEPPRNNTRTKPSSVSKNDLLWALQNRAARVGFIEPGDYSPEARKVIAEGLADEVIYNLGKESGKNAVGWYDAAIKKAKAQYEEVFPELRQDADREMLFDAILGIASQGNDVHSNAVFAGRVYFLMTREGMTLGEAVKTLSGTFGKQTVAIEKNYAKLQHLLDANGYDRARAFFNTKATVGELNAILRKDTKLYGPDGKPLKIEGAAEQTVTGWMVFGPKIGSFINNLHGDYSILTADLWFSRTWNRMLGFVFNHKADKENDQYVKLYRAMVEEARTGKGRDLVGTSLEEIDAWAADPESMLTFARQVHLKREAEYKAIRDEAVTPLRQAAKNLLENREEATEIPRTDQERHFQQTTVEAAQKIIRRKTGVNISIVDIQAVLWYHEKDLYKSFGVGDSKAEAADYADAARRFVERFQEGDLFYVEKPKPRYVWGEKGSYLKDQAAGDRPAILRSPRRLLTAAWSKLAESPDVFQYPKSDADTMQGVFKDLGVGFTVSERFVLSDKETRRGVVKKWIVKGPDGREAEVFRNKKDEIWVNASALKVGVSRGAALYAGLLNYAYNSLGKLIGDPLGVSDMAIFRRTENMLSSALKFGTTEHMAPAKEQQNPALFAGTMGHTSGVTEQFKPLAWSDDHQENLANLLEVSYAHVTRFVPEVKDAYYDFNTGEFRWSATDRPLTRGDFERLARALRRGLGDPTVGVGGAEPAGSDSVPALRPGAVRGGATLQRAILTHTLLRAASSEDGGRSSLAAIGGELRGGLGREGQAPAGSGADLSGILYSKTRLSVSDNGRGAVHATSEDLARAGSVPGAVFATDAGPRVTERLAIGVDRVTTAEEAAHVLAAMRRNAEEKFQVLVLDAEQKPIAVLNLFAGATSQTSVFPGVVAKAVYETPGAATVWYAHNHPSGSPVPSDADLRMTRALSTSFGPGTSIEVGGHVILAGTRYGALEGETGNPLPGGAIKPRARNKSVPVTVRRIKKAGTLADAITSPDEAPQVIERVAQGKTGIVFANAANAPVAFLPMSAEQMQALRDGSSARTLFGAAAKANASVAFLYFDRSVGSAKADRAQRNLAHALNARDVRMLDAFFYNRDGDLTSMAARGILESGDGDGIFRSAARIQTAAFPAPALPDSRSKRVLDKVIYNLQDRLVDLKEIQKSIEAAGRTIRDEFNPYMAETLMHGKAAYRVQHFLEQEIEPVLALMRGAGISVEELNRYLHARHAAERNAAMAKRNPNQDELDQLIQDAGEELLDAELAASADPTDGAAQRRVIRAQTRLDALRAAKPWSGTEEERQRLSGMSNDEAKAILDAAHGGPKAAVYRKLGQKIDAITGQTRSEMAAYGLESLEMVGAMDQAYDHYVPLHRDMDESDLLDTMGGTGRGFSIRGSQVKRATGSLRAVENILANVVAQREATIVRGEKNRVAKALYGLVMEHPNADLYTVVRPGMPEKQLRTELQSMGLDPATVDTMVKAPMVSVINERTGLAERRVNPMYSRLDNAVVLRINGEDRVILFNKKSDRAVRLVRALRNDDAESGGSRFIMDHIGPITRYLAAINTQYNPIFGLTNFVRDLQSAALNLETTPIADHKAQLVGNIPAAIRGIWNWERGDRQHSWAKLYEEFLADGGATGYRDAYGSLADRAAAIERDLGKTGLRNAAGIRQVLTLLSDYNTAVENATRLAAYKAARDAGISRAKAADLAKDITVNFNRKGARSGFWASLYAFFNSAVQGTERTVRVLRGPTGKKILGAGVALGAMNAALGMLLLGDDWDEIPEFERAKHLILPLPWTEQKYVKIPYPLGYNAIPNAGRSVVEMAVYRDRLGERGLALLGETLDAFNPISASTMVGMVMPSVLDPAVELASNQDAFGRPISKEDLSPLDPTPGFTRAREGTAGPFKALAQGINAATGGDDYAPGLWSPTAEQISYVFGVATGGLGREVEKFVATGEATVKGDPLPPYKIPVVGRFYGEAGGDNVIRKQYFDAIREVNIAENQLKGRARDGKDIDGFELGALAQTSRRFQSVIGALQKEALRTRDREERKRINREIVNLQRQFVDLVAQSRP
jgi:hypothetical protein